MVGWIITIIVLAGVGIAAGTGWSKLQKEHKEAMNLPLDGVNFGELIDGVYVGFYEGGMYKWRANKVEVTVEDGRLSKIVPLEGITDQGKVSTKTLYDRVIQNQSLQVDTISGATLTSKAYLKAVENALLQAN